MSPLEALRHHVTGAIERGESEAIEGIQATEKATLSFPSNDMAQDFAKRWSRKTLTGHDMTAIRPDGSRDVTVYGVTEEHKAFISAYIETITNL